MQSFWPVDTPAGKWTDLFKDDIQFNVVVSIFQVRTKTASAPIELAEGQKVIVIQ